MYCINCGIKLEENYRFCAKCGTKILSQNTETKCDELIKVKTKSFYFNAFDYNQKCADLINEWFSENKIKIKSIEARSNFKSMGFPLSRNGNTLTEIHFEYYISENKKENHNYEYVWFHRWAALKNSSLLVEDEMLQWIKSNSNINVIYKTHMALRYEGCQYCLGFIIFYRE